VSLGRRKVGIDDPSSWVFNRMADVYDARPPYPSELIDALAALAAGAPGTWASPSAILDVGAGTGHLALALAARALRVTAVEPAVEMLARLRRAAAARQLALEAHHAAAEAMPVPTGSQSLVVIADALHFLDAQLAAEEIARVLRPEGGVALLTCGFADTPFMRQVVLAMEDAVPRRPRALDRAVAHLAAITRVPLAEARVFRDDTPVSATRLDAILRSISFIGPAMNPTRFAAFRARVHGIAEARVWARTFTLRWGHRAPSRRSLLREHARLRRARAAAGESQETGNDRAR
jgi:ubiquinone/menaquinone biosynthesis C-methylase UbiE